MPLVLDLRITHERFGRSSDLSINGNVHYPNDKNRSLNEDDDDKILKYRTDYNNNPPISTAFMPVIGVPLGGYIVNSLDYYSYRIIGKLTVFLQLQEFNLHNIPMEESSLQSVRSSSHSSRQKSAVV